MTVTETQVTWLTQEAHDRLKGELDELKENGGYHAAREEQGQQEARIRQLQELLRTAQVGTAPVKGDTASPGMVLTLRYDGDEDTETVLLGSREEGSRADLEVVSPNSPLGGALLGAHPGDTRSYQLPDGGSMQVTLVSAEPFRA